MDTATIRPKDLLAMLPALMEAREPVMIYGPPGIGKSSIVHQAARNVAWGCEGGPMLWDIRAVLMDPVDLRGLPNLKGKDGLTHWLPPASLPQPGEFGCLFLDELPQAPPAMQSALLQLTLDRAIGDYVLPDGVAIVAAGNRPEDRTGASRLITALADRFVKVTLEPDFDAWVDYVQGQQLVGADMLSFLRWKPSAFCVHDVTKLANPNPRNWVKASKIYGSLATRVSRPALAAALTGTLGTIATDLLAFLDLRAELLTADQMLADPEHCRLPARVDMSWAVAGSLAAYFARPTTPVTPETIVALYKLLLRFGDEQSIVCYLDVGRTSACDLLKRGILTPEGRKFSAKNPSLMRGTL